MSLAIARLELRYEQDVVYARQRARRIAKLLGFEHHDQTRLGTALSEIARNAYQYGGGGTVEFFIEDQKRPQRFGITVSDQGPGIANLEALLEGHYVSPTGLGLGIIGTRRLLDDFHIASTADQGTKVTFGKPLPPTAPLVTAATLRRITEDLANAFSASPLEEIRTQNQELLAALEQLRQREEELTGVNSELMRTNDGMIALYSELEQKAVAIEKTEALLRTRNEELKGFAYTVSHDLKAPLRGIAGYAQELDRKHRGGLSDRAQFCLTQILTATRNLDHLIEDLLHFSRLDAETPSPTTVNLRDLIDTILQDRSLIIAEQSVEVTDEIPAATAWLWERGLVQVLTNLIDNALKYSRNANPPRLGIRVEELETVWRFSIQDNGIGFDMKYHDRIFGLFNRLVRVDEFEGTGAGLAIVKKVLDKQDGRIWAQSARNQGSTFFVELPKLGAPK
ncbi:MAG: ATP-binding protein [Acidobacteria bacterium]|nr:ATP-binding protein [Acidobacteriota bacterium]